MAVGRVTVRTHPPAHGTGGAAHAQRGRKADTPPAQVERSPASHHGTSLRAKPQRAVRAGGKRWVRAPLVALGTPCRGTGPLAEELQK